MWPRRQWPVFGLQTALALTLACFFTCIGLTQAQAQAQTSDLAPDQAEERLSEIDSRIEQSRAAVRTAQQQSEGLQREVTSLQERLVATAHTVRMHEEEMAALERQLARLSLEERRVRDHLEARRAELAGLLSAVSRLTRLPPEALIVRPGRAAQAAQTSILLNALVPILREELERVRGDLERIRLLRENLRRGREDLHEVQHLLTREEENLRKLMTARRAEMAAIFAQEKAEAERLAALMSEAETVEALMEQLAEEQAHLRAVETVRRHALSVKQAQIDAVGQDESFITASSLPALTPDPAQRAARRNLTLPVLGEPVTRFGEKNANGIQSPGLVLAARSGATVVAPGDGVVRFAGAFRGYGQLIIIDHEDGYHSLLSGFERPEVSPGQFVLAGEPVARMRSGQTVPHLYFEFRRTGKPIDPAPLMPTLLSEKS